MTNMKKNLVITALMAFLGLGMLLPFNARASEAGRRNTTLGLGALTVGLGATRHWIPAAVAGVGTYAAYHNWQAQINHRHRTQSRLAYRHAYRLGYTQGHHRVVRHTYARRRHRA